MRLTAGVGVGGRYCLLHLLHHPHLHPLPLNPPHLLGPAQGSKGEKSRREPCVQDIRIWETEWGMETTGTSSVLLCTFPAQLQAERPRSGPNPIPNLPDLTSSTPESAPPEAQLPSFALHNPDTHPSAGSALPLISQSVLQLFFWPRSLSAQPPNSLLHHPTEKVRDQEE